jgi:hypothetical protein
VQLAQPPRRVGPDGTHLQLKLKNGAHALSCIAFGQGDRADAVAARPFDVAFTPRPSTFAGNGVVELLVADVRVEAAAATV